MRSRTGVACVGLLAGISSCVPLTTVWPLGQPRVSGNPEEGEDWALHLDQEYDFAYVLRRSKDLKPGMRRLDVLFLLGRPKIMDRDRWTYLPEGIAAGKLFDTLVVYFRGDRLLRSAVEKCAFRIGR